MINNKFICNYCNSEFEYNKSLLRHQRSNKKCLEIQEKSSIDYKCTFCRTSFTRNSSKLRHEKTCKLKVNTLDSDEEELSDDEYKFCTKEDRIKYLEYQLKQKDIIINKINKLIFQRDEEIKTLQDDNKTLILHYQKEIKKRDKEIKKQDKEINKLIIKNYQTELSHKTLTIENLYLKDDKNQPLRVSNNKLPEFNKQNCIFDNKRLQECMKQLKIDDLYNPFKCITKKIFQHLLLDTKNQLLYVNKDPNRHNYIYYDRFGRQQRDMGENQLSLFIQPELHKRLVVLKQDFIKDKGTEDFDEYIKPILDIQSLSDINTINRFFREIDKLILGHVNDIVNQENKKNQQEEQQQNEEKQENEESNEEVIILTSS